MRHLWLLLLAPLGCSPLTPPDDGGSGSQPICYAPPDGGVFLTGLTAPVPGCSRTGAPTGVIDLDDAGWSKQGGVLVVPPSAPGTPLPVVFAFHGAFSSGQTLRANLGLEAAADGGAIFIYPNAFQGTWDIGPHSLDGRRTDTLLRLLSENYCIDPDRISITGVSAGAVFTLYLGCNVPDTFHALGVVAGTSSRFDNRCCTHPISGLFIHGTADEAVPLFEGQAARDEVILRDGCRGVGVPLDAHCSSYTCPQPLAVNYCEWGGTHEIPDWAGGELWRFVSAP